MFHFSPLSILYYKCIDNCKRVILYSILIWQTETELIMQKSNVITFRKPIICGICSKKEFPKKEQKYFVFSKASQDYKEQTVCSACFNREEKKYEYKLEA